MVSLLYVLSSGIYTTLVSGIAIPTSFSILINILVSLVFTKCNLEANAIACYSPTLFQLQPALSMYAIMVYTRVLTGSQKVSVEIHDATDAGVIV